MVGYDLITHTQNCIRGALCCVKYKARRAILMVCKTQDC